MKNEGPPLTLPMYRQCARELHFRSNLAVGISNQKPQYKSSKNLVVKTALQFLRYWQSSFSLLTYYSSSRAYRCLHPPFLNSTSLETLCLFYRSSISPSFFVCMYVCMSAFFRKSYILDITSTRYQFISTDIFEPCLLSRPTDRPTDRPTVRLFVIQNPGDLQDATCSTQQNA